jgi:hypothetical protein
MWPAAYFGGAERWFQEGDALVLPPIPLAVRVTEFLLHPTNEKDPLSG